MQDLRWHVLNQKRLEFLLAESFRIFRKHGIEPIAIKGYAAALNYPPGHIRLYSDIDLAVADADYNKARTLLRTDPDLAFGIDLHRELRGLDTVPWDRLFMRSSTVSVSGEEIRILSAEDHLRVLAVHWLINGGADKERLWDVYYAVENAPEDFDWQKCLAVLPPHRGRWIMIAIGLAHLYLGLNIDRLPFRSEATKIPSWIKHTIEKEWNSRTPFRPLESSTTTKREFLAQLWRRLPPNPIQCTINMDGDLDAAVRLHYQIGDMAKRLIPSLKRLTSHR